MTIRPLPRLVRWLVRAVVPRPTRAQAIADLADDYARVQASRPGRARIWLLRETASLLAAYSAASVSRMKRSAPMWMRDLRLVMRGLRKGPMAAVGAAAMLSAGLVAVLLTVGLTRSLLLRQVSAAHGDAVRRIVTVDRQGRQAPRFSLVELHEVRTQLGDAAALTAVNLAPIVVRTSGSDIQTMAEVIDGQYFGITGMTTVIGRALLATDDQLTAPPAVVLSQPMWRRQFGASPDVLGQIVQINGAPFTIVGVAASIGSSSFLGASVDAWVPLQHADALLTRGWRTSIDQRLFTAFALPSADNAEVDGRLAAASADLAQRYPDQWRDRRLHTADGTVLIGSQRNAVMMLVAILGALALLILIAAASNVSGVLLARAAATRRLAAIHMSMGSGRASIVRRQLLEGALLGAAGGVMALALYLWARTRFAEIAILPTLALRIDLPLDAVLVAGLLTIACVAGTLLAIGPAVWIAHLDLAGALRDAESRTGGGRGVTRARRALVSAQVCLSLTLTVGAALFSQSVNALARVDLGFPTDRLVAMDFDVEPSGPAASELPLLARDALRRAQAVPGVIAAAMSNRAPVDQSTPAIDVRAAAPGGALASDVSVYLATTDYFAAVGVPLIAGRAFTDAETLAAADVAIVNEALAARLWPGEDALGRGLYLPGESTTLRIVGIARNAKYRTVTESERPHLYRPTPPGISLTLLARTVADPRDTLRALQRVLDEVGPGIVGFFPRTLDDHLAIQLLPARAAAGAAAGLGFFALVMSAVGLYGLVSWFVELRQREIGVRMALGATRGDVRALVVRQALTSALPGMAAGLALSIALGLAARAALFGVSPIDPVALSIGVSSIGAVVMVAAYLPCRRATRTDPSEALRT